MSVKLPARRGRTFAELTGLPAHPFGHPEHDRSQRRYEFMIPDTRRDLACGVYLTMALARKHPDPVVVKLYEEVETFFRLLEAQLVLARQGDRVAFQRAVRMCDFPEPGELGCGYTTNARNGHGVGEGTLSRRILYTLLQYPALSKACAEEPDSLALVEQVGIDRVSDVISTIGKRHLIEYTKQMARQYRFDLACLRRVRIGGIWSAGAGTLVTEEHLLPVADDGRAILLVPKGIVRSAPPFNTEQYTRYYYGYSKGRLSKADVLADIDESPGRLLAAMREVLREDWRYRPRRDLRAE